MAANQPTEDERSIANKLERESKREDVSDKQSADEEARKKDATLPVRSRMYRLAGLGLTAHRPRTTATSQARVLRSTRSCARRRRRSSRRRVLSVPRDLK